MALTKAPSLTAWLLGVLSPAPLGLAPGGLDVLLIWNSSSQLLQKVLQEGLQGMELKGSEKSKAE